MQFYQRKIPLLCYLIFLMVRIEKYTVSHFLSLAKIFISHVTSKIYPFNTLEI